MRKDMKDLLVDTGRIGGRAAAEGRRARFKRTPEDDLPNRIPISRHRQFGYDCKSLGDRLAPLTGFLDKNVGRQWDDVYSEICEHADMRSVRGYHLRLHVWADVVPNNYDVGHRQRYGPFFVDEDGTLQREKPCVWPSRPSKTNPLLILDVDHWWEKIEGFWFAFETTHVMLPNSREELVQKEDGEVEIVRIPLPDKHHHETTKCQVDGATQACLDAKYAEKIEA